MENPNDPTDWCAEIPNFAQETFIDYLAGLDWQKGKTKHEQTFCGFLRAWSLGIDPEFARNAIVRCIIDAGGELLPLEVERQQMRAREYLQAQGNVSATTEKRPPKAMFSPDALKTVAAKVNLPDPQATLRERSAFPPETTTPAGFLEALFVPGECIVIFTDQRSQGQAVHVVGGGGESAIPTGSPNGVWFLIQPVDGKFHWNPRGKKKSRRSEEAVTAWRYLLLEADEADSSDWMRALMQLPLRIVAIYTSGGRSVHALVRVDAATKPAWDEIKDDLKPVVVTLGADPQALSAVRLSRLPNCRRRERLQELLYLDPAADCLPIISKPKRTREVATPDEGGAE